MSTSHANRDASERELLADVVVRCREEIEQRWIESVARSVKGRDISMTELRDSLPDYLLRLADGLRQANPTGGGYATWETVARSHAAERVRLGFDIDQLVHEFIVLRQVILRVVESERGAPLDSADTRKLADLIEGAIQAAVKSYVASRDYEARKQEAEHIGFITHELRNPLTTAVLGTNQLARTGPLSVEQRRTLAIVERSQRRLAELIDSVLLVERDTYTLKAHPIVTTLGQVLEPTVSAARLAAETKGLHFEAVFDPDIVIHVDPKLASSALESVMENAVKYTELGDVQLLADDDPGEVVIHVRDSCPGISPAELQTIFEPFRRASSKQPGAGLGLAIARRAVEAQGGTIHAESGEEKGCHFWLTLPKAPH